MSVSVTTALSRRFALGIAWNLISAVSNQGSTFLVNVLLARFLGQLGFGVYAIVLGSIQNLALLAGLAVGYTATRYLAEFRTSDRPRAGRVLGFCLLTAASSAGVGAAALVLLAPLIANRVLHDTALTPLLQMAGVAGFFVVLNGALMGALAGLEAFRSLGIANLCSGSLYVALGLLGAWWLGLPGAVAGLVASATAQTILLGATLRREAHRQSIRVIFKEPAAERTVMLRFALPSAVAGISAAAALWLVQLLLVRGPRGFAELAGYVAAFNLVAIVLFLPNLINTVASSVLNTLVGSGAAREYRRAFWLNFGVTAFAVGSGAVTLVLLSSRLLALYGKDFTAATGVLLLLAIGSIPDGLTTAVFQLIQSRERMWQGVRSVVLPRELVFLIAAAQWIPARGAQGLAAAFLLARVVGLALALWMVRSMLADGTTDESWRRAQAPS